MVNVVISIPTDSGSSVICNLVDVFLVRREGGDAGLWVKGVCVGTVSKSVCHEICCAMTKDNGYNLLHFGWEEIGGEKGDVLDALIDRVVSTRLMSGPLSHDEYQLIEDALICYRGLYERIKQAEDK